MQTFELSVVTENEAKAGQLAKQLERAISDLDIGVEPSIRKDRPNTQDFGATLVLVLGAPATIALATAIAAFIKRNSGVHFKLTPVGGAPGVNVEAANLNSADAKEILKAFAPK